MFVNQRWPNNQKHIGPMSDHEQWPNTNASIGPMLVQCNCVRREAVGLAGKKKNARFSVGHNILLLREVVTQNPCTAIAGEVTRTWAAIAAALNAAQAAFNVLHGHLQFITLCVVSQIRH